MKLNRISSVFAVLAMLITVNSFAAKMESHTSNMFQGPKANTGTVSHYVENGIVGQASACGPAYRRVHPPGKADVA